MWQLARDTDRAVARRGRTRRPAAGQRRRSRSAGRAAGRRHSRAAPCAPSWRASSDTNIVLFTTRIKQGPRTPSDDHPLKLKVTFCVRGVISPLLSNIYLHVLDTVWTRRYTHLGVLVRYADDFVVMCDTKAACGQAEQRVREIFARLGLELHPDKTRQVDLSRGREGFDFLSCHMRKRMSGPTWER